MEELLKKYFNSVLNPGEYSKISDYLSDKTHEQKIYELIKPEWDSQLQSSPEFPEPNKALINKILQAIELEEGKTAIKKLEIYKWFVRIAAILVVGLFAGSLFFYSNNRKLSVETNQPVIQTISIPNGARTNFSLPDGSMVWLNSGSTLSFPSRYDNERNVTLSGEAYFEVAKNGMPFIVSTRFGKVKVTGTSFNVKAFDDNNFIATLVSGSVKVSASNPDKVLTLLPGQQSTLSSGEFYIENVETDLFTSWKEGKLIFRHEYLPVIAQRLGQWYNVKIELANDPRLQKIWYTGTIEMESFSEVLGLLKVTANIDYTYNEKSRIIKITYKQRK